ncbi:rhodanese-like domain-containing protein [Thermodesulfobacteriota bacterium]
MGLMEFFTTVPTISAAEAKRLLAEKGATHFNLIDVRQPGEYEQHHLAGAHLIPLGELKDRINEIDPVKPTIAY